MRKKGTARRRRQQSAQTRRPTLDESDAVVRSERGTWRVKDAAWAGALTVGLSALFSLIDSSISLDIPAVLLIAAAVSGTILLVGVYGHGRSYRVNGTMLETCRNGRVLRTLDLTQVTRVKHVNPLLVSGASYDFYGPVQPRGRRLIVEAGAVADAALRHVPDTVEIEHGH